MVIVVTEKTPKTITFVSYPSKPIFSVVKLSNTITRYRTLTIYNVFFEQNKKAEGCIRNTPTGDSVGVNCFLFSQRTELDTCLALPLSRSC